MKPIPRILTRLIAAALSIAANTAIHAQQPTPSNADGPWSGRAQCVLSVRGPNYQDEQTHTWTITGDSPGYSGAFRVWPATWTVTGSGSRTTTSGGVVVSGENWTTTVSNPNAALSIWELPGGSGRIRIGSQHTPLVAINAIKGQTVKAITAPGGSYPVLAAQGTQFNGNVGEVQFPAVEGDGWSEGLSDSVGPRLVPGSGWQQPNMLLSTETCTWSFSRTPLSSALRKPVPGPRPLPAQTAAQPPAVVPPLQGAGSKRSPPPPSTVPPNTGAAAGGAGAAGGPGAAGAGGSAGGGGAAGAGGAVGVGTAAGGAGTSSGAGAAGSGGAGGAAGAGGSAGAAGTAPPAGPASTRQSGAASPPVQYPPAPSQRTAPQQPPWQTPASTPTSTNGVARGTPVGVVNTPSSTGTSPGSQEFKASGTFTIPTGVTRIVVEIWGAGAGGGTGGINVLHPPFDGQSGTGGRGGGGGAYARAALSVDAGSVLAIAIGAGGKGGAGGAYGADGFAALGEDGGATEVRQGATVLVSANGGVGDGKGGITVTLSAPGVVALPGLDGAAGSSPTPGSSGGDVPGKGGAGGGTVMGTMGAAGTTGGAGGAGGEGAGGNCGLVPGSNAGLHCPALAPGWPGEAGADGYALISW
jgi:hypothetical protein